MFELDLSPLHPQQKCGCKVSCVFHLVENWCEKFPGITATTTRELHRLMTHAKDLRFTEEDRADNLASRSLPHNVPPVLAVNYLQYVESMAKECERVKAAWKELRQYGGHVAEGAEPRFGSKNVAVTVEEAVALCKVL